MHFNPAELHMAIIYKNLEAVEYIVKSGGNLDRLWRGSSPVSCALYTKTYNILEYLVKHGANVNIRTVDYKMEPPLFAACRLSKLNAVNILLQSTTVDIDQKDFFNRTPLWAAARYSNYEMVELLLNRGADIRSAQDFIECPLIQSVLMLQRNFNSTIPGLLIRRGCILDYKNHEGTPLYFSVKFRNKGLFRLLVRAGCRVKNENWLSLDELPLCWKLDEPFCEWICSLHNNPRSLLQLSSCAIRNRLVESHKNLFPCHVKELPIPSTLKKLLLLED
ncbi:hypothetical protein JTE90_009417 [Oedothorax gibbosus]|uniref:Alpha-latrotoxin n=1 Tax=Oedothorax gibbosus TaxID=931172 RepID=A0AAV6VTZ1_9ARAC|nr:hypothetical protein JTE90_009417 [Oedothorax gibbosus]